MRQRASNQVLLLCLSLGLMISVACTGRKHPLRAGDPERGRALFSQCARCHYADSTLTKVGPGLKGLFKKHEMLNGLKPTEDNVRAKIGACGYGISRYEKLLTNQEKDDLIAYLKTF